ncbi:hypothetical protein [Rahnella sp. PCH160]|uniref:hypothetical protein n=1 Tax=Rahnella sp. PCH160 TaxID=3447928 RepID=UPI0039FB90C5
MNNISIESDNYYVREAIKSIISDFAFLTHKSQSVSVFFFEKKWVTRNEFYTLLMCQSDRVMIIGSDVVLSFIENNILIKNLCLLSSKASLNTMKMALEHFLNGIYSGLLTYPEPSEDAYKLSGKATRIISLYLSGVSMTRISKLEKINAKTLYAYKAKVMAEKGLISALSLVNHWKMVRLAEIYLENMTPVKCQNIEKRKNKTTTYEYQVL